MSPWIHRKQHLDTVFHCSQKWGEIFFPKSKRWETGFPLNIVRAEPRAMLHQAVCRNVLFRGFLIAPLQESTKLGAEPRLGTDSPRPLHSCWTYRNGCLQKHFEGSEHRTKEKERERRGRAVPLLLVHEGVSSSWHLTTFAVEFHGAQGVQINASREKFLLNAVSISGQNSTGLDHIPGSKHVERYSQGRGDESTVKMVYSGVSHRGSELGCLLLYPAAHITLDSCSRGANASASAHTCLHLHMLPGPYTYT